MFLATRLMYLRISIGSNECLNDPLTKAFADVFRSGSQISTGHFLSCEEDDVKNMIEAYRVAPPRSFDLSDV